ncbi:MAG: hypothetical protein WC699_01260 [Bacteroidales bacterium]|jgi:hypothetical protein
MIPKLLITLTGVFVLFSLPEHATCQSEQKPNIIHLTGRTITENNEPVPYVHIILVNKKVATASDLQGTFNFPAEINDTILFTAIGFKFSKLIVRDTFPVKYPYIPIVMFEDTIQLRELVIRPWQGSYERFKQAVISYKLPVTDLDRAEKNLNMMDLKALLINAPPTPTMSFRNTMKVYNDRLYWAGQLPPVSITNPLAWAQFFKALKNGDFRKK